MGEINWKIKEQEGDEDTRKGRKGGAERRMGRSYSGRAFCEALISECVHVWLPPTHPDTIHTGTPLSICRLNSCFLSSVVLFFLTPSSRTVKISWLNPQQLPPPTFLLPALLNLLPFSIQTQVFLFYLSTNSTEVLCFVSCQSHFIG